ncbi:hypothetical protein ACS0TY_025279 [Phlomoides rotata]
MEMAAAFVKCIKCIAEPIKCIAEPIKRQFISLCCFNTNIQNLRDEATRLDGAKVVVEGNVDAARRNNLVIVPLVETWLRDVNEIQAQMTAIEPEIRNVRFKSRFSLSRKASEMAETMKNLQDDYGKLGQISLPALPAAMTSISTGQIYELQSRKHVEEDIMATLREKKLRMMGICGMGGVGKTTMAKKIMSRASRERGEGLFDEIVIVVVSQPVDMSKIQNEMAELLGLELKVNGAFARAHELRKRLMNSKSILIILDDVWENLNLEDLGIPDQKDCTIFLTSRNADVFGAMNVEKTFQMINLKDEEALSLFKEKVGACADDPNLFSTAQQIVGECKGLPLALVTVGGALKDETNKAIWENSLQELKSSNPDIQDFLEEVYNPLKLSYDLLKSDPAKLIFLMCCLFPEDHEISISDLSLYAWGLRKFDAWGLRASFGRLEYLTIDGYDSISSLWCDKIPIDFFTRLVYLIVRNCDNIKSLFSLPIARNLFNLRELTIESCGEMVKVIEGEDVERSLFIKLKVLRLQKLPKLTSFCKGIQSIEFPLLTYMSIGKCPNLKSLVSSTENDKTCSGAINHDACESLHLFCKSQASFGRLEYLTIDGYDSISSLWCDKIPIDFFTRLVYLIVRNCDNIKSLFSLSIARNLFNLRELSIESCGEMVKVIEGEDVERSLFIKLEVLRLENLPKLKTFCDWRCVLELPSLEEVYISKCPEMERFSFGSLTTPNLEGIIIDWEDISDYTKDLNDAVFGGNFLHLEILFGSD